MDSWSKHPFSSASLVLVSYYLLPETRQHDVVSMHECCTFFLFMLSMSCKCSLFALLMTSKEGQVGGGEGGRTGSRRLPSLNLSLSSGDI